MDFGELREAVHRGDWGCIADADLTPEEEGYVDRMVGVQMKRYRDARALMELEDPLSYKVCRASSKESEGLGDLLRWYACDIAEESMRLYGNGDGRILKAIEVARLYVLGEVGEEELKRARNAAWAASFYAASEAAASSSYAAWAAASSSYAAWAASSYYAAEAASSYDVTREETHDRLTGWFRCYLMRWVEEGEWWIP